MTISHRAWKRLEDSHGYGKKEIDEMIELAEQGWLTGEIAVRFRLEVSTVADLLVRGARRNSLGKKTPPAEKQLKRLPEQELIELYVKSKFSIAYILEKLHTDYASLYISLRHYGIPLRDARHRAAAEENAVLLHRLAFEEHLSPRIIAERLGLTEAYVKRKISEMKCFVRVIKDHEF